MNDARTVAMWMLLAALAGCRDGPVCPLEGTWEVTAVGCSGGSGGLPKPIDATYTFEGGQGHTRWALPGCTVEAHFDVAMEGPEVQVRERRHVCAANEAPDGQPATPCCDTADVDVALTYTCRASAQSMSWMAALAAEGPTGPWAGRGPWRGCRPGDVGMMRLERPSEPTAR